MNWNKLFNKTNHQGILRVKNKLKQLGFKKDFKIFNIVGTNGKGSLAKYLTDSFIESGKKVGTFTSPHIFKVNERIKINNKYISNKQLWKRVKNLNFSFFECLYIAAMLYFQENKIDIAIIEAGIGGSKDTTNAIPGDYGAVTSIGIDHEDILGNTEEKIAKDKSGIINKNMQFFIPNSINNNLRKYFEKGDYQIIKNKSSNYKLENINLAKGIAKKLQINSVINDIPYRTSVSKNNNCVAIKDVAHNLDGIKASIKYLKNHKINFDKVVISINKKKWKPEIKSLFKNKKIEFYAPDENYYCEKKSIKNLTKEYSNQNVDTLYIGTFKTISKLKNNKKITSVIDRLLLGNAINYKLNIFMITIAAILLSISQISGYFLRFNIGPMRISLDYVFYMLFGLLFGILYGSMFAFMNDLLKMLFISGIGKWMWQYAIIAPAIVIISSLFKEFVWNKKKNWLLITTSIFIIIDVIALTTIIINNVTATDEFKNRHQILINIFYATLPILILIQITLFIFYKKQKNKKQVTIRIIINSIALTMLVIVIMSWVWGPFAFLAYANRFIYNHHESIKNKYLIFLIPRIIKAIPEGLIWSTCIFSIYEILDLTTKKILKNRW